uniref:Cleavage and polyadenylation specificity factor subunit 4 n=1 Tax=Zonotrichia albicollis TaxID=44394 RepID=A0A8D2QG56_ZONAL
MPPPACGEKCHCHTARVAVPPCQPNRAVPGHPNSSDPAHPGGIYSLRIVPSVPCLVPTGECSNKDCPFLHAGATASTGRCPWYDRGFCWHGPLCKYKHMRRVMCANYLVGFCPEGPKCKFVQYVLGGLGVDLVVPRMCHWSLAPLKTP